MKGNLDLLLSQCLGPCALRQMSATTHGIHYMHMQQTFTSGFLFSLSFLFYLLLLGGLSLHLNHLIQSCMEISYRLFGTLPIGLLLSNLDSRQLETSPMTSYDQF